MSGDPRATLDQADKLVSSGDKAWFNKQDKYEEAAIEYAKAANMFKRQKMYNEAGATFEKAADVHKNKLKEPMDAAHAYSEAFGAYKLSNPQKAIQCADLCVDYQCNNGSFRRAASYKEQAGELIEAEGDLKKACEYYETAAEWYAADNAPALANKRWVQVADISALEGDYAKASEIYSSVSDKASKNNVFVYSIKTWLFKRGLCDFASGDMIVVTRFLTDVEKAQQGDIMVPAEYKQLAGTSEHELLVAVQAAIEANDQEMFGDAAYKYDKMFSKGMDPWYTKLLLRIKNNSFEEEDFS